MSNGGNEFDLPDDESTKSFHSSIYYSEFDFF